MRSRRPIWSVWLVSLYLAGAAIAADLTGEEAKKLVSGNTIYLETTAASVTGTPGKGVVYYAPDGTALYKTPSGALWHGTWAIKGNLLCTEYKEGPKRPCLKFDKQGDVISYLDSESGQIRARMIKTAPGNPENLQP